MSAKFPLPARPSFAAPIPLDASSTIPVNAEAGPSTLSPSRSLAVDSTSPTLSSQPTPSVPSAPPQRPPIDPTKCALCPSAPKYTCPRCALPTCSLPCSSSHKTLFACSGQRDTSAFVPLSKYTQGEWGGDYAFLEATRRQISMWGKDVSMREVERQEEVRKVKEREERRRYREERWKEGQREREEEEKRREKEERVREAKERGEVGWGREFVPGLPGTPGQMQSQLQGVAAAGALATGNASTPTGSTLAPTATATPQVTPHYASLLDPATTVALNRANLGPDDSSQRGGRGPHNNHHANKKRPNRGGKLEAFMWEMRKRGVWVEFMPEGMERRRVNQSRWNAGSQELFITLQMIIPLALLPPSAAPTTTTGTSHTAALSQEESAEAESGAGPAAASAEGTSEPVTASALAAAPATASASAPRLATPPGVKIKYSDKHATVTFTQVLLYKGDNTPGQGGGGHSATGGGAARGRGRNRGKGQTKDAEGTIAQTGDEGVLQNAEEAQAKEAGGADVDAEDQVAGKSQEENHEAKEREAATSTSKHVLPTLSDLFSSLSTLLSPQSLVFALPFHPSPARPAPVSETATGTVTHMSNGNNNKGKPHFPPLSTTAPLATALRGTAYVEFPILTVYARDQWEGMKSEGKVREVGLAEPRNKRDTEGGAGVAGPGAGAGQRHGRQGGTGQESQGQGQGRGANEVPLSNKRTIGSVQAQTSGAGVDLEKSAREAKRSKVEHDQAGTAGTSSSAPTSAGSTMPGLPAKPATPAASALTAAPSVSIAQARTASASLPPPLRPTAARAATSGLSALGGYGSDSDSDSDPGAGSEAEAEAGGGDGHRSNEDANDLGYYDKPSADETALPGTAAAGPSSTSSIGSMGAATQPQQQQQAQAQSSQNGSKLSASSLADEFGLSGEMMQAVGKALAADLA